MKLLTLLTLFLVAAMLVLSGMASAQDITPNQSCVAVSVARYYTGRDNFVLTNNCGKAVTLYFIQPDDAPWGPGFAQLTAGQSLETGIPSSWTYKMWGCFSGTPVDAETGDAPRYGATNVACR